MCKVVKKRLGDIVNFKRGYDLPTYNRIEGEYPIISSSGISGYHSEYKREGEGLVTGRYGTLGEVYYINGRYWPHNTALYVTDFKGNYPKYVYFLMKCLGNLKTSDKSTVPGINRNDLHELVVPFIKKEFQKPLADLLFNIETKIDLNNRINVELEAMAKTLYDYWFVQFDFPFDFAQGKPDSKGKPYKTNGGKMVWNEELKREIPEWWEVKKLGGLGNFKNGVNYDPSEPGNIACPIINVRNISASSFFLKNEDLDIVYLNETEIRKYSVHNGSIIIARSGIPGATRLVSGFRENTLYCGFAIHFELHNLLNKIPVFFYLKSIEQQIQNGSGGTILKNVNQGTLSSLKVVLPKNNAIIERFNKLIDPIFNKINLIAEENQHLFSLRDWLLPMLMNGQVTVGEAEKAVSQAEEELMVAAEPAADLIKNNAKHTKQEAFLRKLMLASHIVYELCDESTFGHTKLMKLLYLSEQVGNMALQTNYKKFAAGPFDGKTLTLIDQEYEKNKWFNLEKRSYTVNGQQREATIYKKTEKSLCYKKHFDNYFEQESDSINKLISLFRNEKTQTAEIVATLYFAWEELLAKKTIISESILIKEFYDFHKEKKKFTKEQILDGYRFMLKHGVHP